MKPRTLRRRAAWAAAEIAVILVLHAALIRVLAGSDVAATLLSAGAQAPRLHVAAALGFALVRALAVLLLPGIILSRLVQLALHRWSGAGAETAGAPDGGPGNGTAAAGGDPDRA